MSHFLICLSFIFVPILDELFVAGYKLIYKRKIFRRECAALY